MQTIKLLFSKNPYKSSGDPGHCKLKPPGYSFFFNLCKNVRLFIHEALVYCIRIRGNYTSLQIT